MAHSWKISAENRLDTDTDQTWAVLRVDFPNGDCDTVSIVKDAPHQDLALALEALAMRLRKRK